MTYTKYTKTDLVEFVKWHSNAPVSIINKASVTELEAFIQRGNAWEKFFEELEKNREYRQLEQKSNQLHREIKKFSKMG